MNRVVNGIRLWCSICLGHPKASIGVLGAGVMMGLANSRVGCDSESGG